jgi:protein gp37
MGTKISWTDETWNPIVGCSHCSPGCDHCYAERMARRQAAMALEKSPCPDITTGQGKYVAVIGPDGKWNGSTVVDDGKGLHMSGEMIKPLKIKMPRRIFVCSMSDLFHENTIDGWIGQVLDIQRAAPQHTYIWLTKRPERMRSFISGQFGHEGPGKNVWCGVTVCNQKEADKKIPVLLKIPATVRFISIEPMLGPIDISRALGLEWSDNLQMYLPEQIHTLGGHPKLDWVIVGGESGPGARPMSLDWALSIRDQCKMSGTPFFFKQVGGVRKKPSDDLLDGIQYHEMPKAYYEWKKEYER